MSSRLSEKEIKVHVDRQFPLTDASEALEVLDSGGATSKVVLTTNAYAELNRS